MSEGLDHKTAMRLCVHGIFKHGECAECKGDATQAALNYAKEVDSNWNSVLRTAVVDDQESTKEHSLGDCLDEAKKTICGERQDVYGSPEDSFALVAEYWSTYLRKQYNSDHHHLTAKDIAHMMILFKMARVQGQAPKRDNYVDICGYASIAADRF